MQNDINKYDQNKFQEYFQKTSIYHQLLEDFDILSFEYHFQPRSKWTPRQNNADRNLPTKFSVVPFYYLDYLVNANPVEIYDIGCGWNIFKKYIPNIIGVGAESLDSGIFYGDKFDHFDDDYVLGHQNYFESVFSINALHFCPLSKIRQRVLDFSSIIRPGGKGFLALNCKRMMEVEHIDEFHIVEIENQIRTDLYTLPFELEVFEVDLSTLDNWMDGNIRMIIKK